MIIKKKNSDVKSGRTIKTQKSGVTAALNSKTEAVEYIKSAIHTLGATAKDDIIAKEAIANLSVILFDLKE